MAPEEPADEPDGMTVERVVKDDARALLLYTWPDDEGDDAS